MKEEPTKGVCEESVYDQTFLRVAPLLRNFLIYRTGDAGKAEDLVQDAFLKLWDNCTKVAPEKAKAFVFRVAENLFFNQVEHAKVVLKFNAHQAGISEKSETPQDLMEENEFREKLERAIAALPAGAREVFLLNRVEGMKYREIAELLNISQKAVEKRMSRALLDLRKIHKSL
ncbi:MAG: RNA polymerase sigma-70 factor (family 1) [Paraglaciecola sp.]|jgi:RNA polymerase sigma-70 factor (family 1)